MDGPLTLLVSGCFPQKTELIRAYLEASKATWRSSVYDHFDITLRREMDARGRPKILSLYLVCKVDPAHHPPIFVPNVTGHGTKNIRWCQGM